MRVERHGKVAVVMLDAEGASVNTLSTAHGAWLMDTVQTLVDAPEVAALVIASGKADFLVGADIHELAALTSEAQALELSQRAQAGMARLAAAPKPIVAAVHGHCLGAGLELVLACRGVVAAEEPTTRLGLPEVRLGLLPGAGGTQRLLQRVGLSQALPLLLTGKQLRPAPAHRLGLIDMMVPRALLLPEALKYALMLADGSRQAARPRSAKLAARLVDATWPGQQLALNRAKREVVAKTGGHYPAPLAILEVLEAGLADAQRGYDAEASAFARLSQTAVCRKLVGIFTATQQLKSEANAELQALAPPPISRVGILGAGLMGSGIAEVSLQHGLAVRLRDHEPKALARGLHEIHGYFAKRVAKKRMTARERDEALGRLTTALGDDPMRGCELVIEAVFENADLKRSLLHKLGSAHPAVIFASNTSTIPITELARDYPHPERVIGMHYFSPVPQMPLLEIIITPQTAPAVRAACVALGHRQGKTVIVVNDGPGFYTSRILAPYLNEAMHLVAEGVAIDVIDAALVAFGFPVGPLKLLDEVGLDVALHASSVMSQALATRLPTPAGLEGLARDDRKGRKNGRGFYRYTQRKDGTFESAKGKAAVDGSVYEALGLSPRRDIPAEEIAARVVLRMVNEAVYCLQDGVLRSERDGDIGAIFGLGFPPFLGGPFRYARARGPQRVAEELASLQQRLGERFAPAPPLVAGLPQTPTSR